MGGCGVRRFGGKSAGAAEVGRGMTIGFLVVAGVLLAYANGANDNFKALATVYGSSTLSYRAALWLATAAQVAGSVASVLLAGALLAAFAGHGLVGAATVANPALWKPRSRPPAPVNRLTDCSVLALSVIAYGRAAAAISVKDR